MLLVPVSTFLYNSPAALARHRDCKIRQRRLTQTLVFGVTQDLLYAAQGADAAGARFIDANRPMPPQSVVRRYVDFSAPSRQCAQHTKSPLQTCLGQDTVGSEQAPGAPARGHCHRSAQAQARQQTLLSCQADAPLAERSEVKAPAQRHHLPRWTPVGLRCRLRRV